LISLLHSWQQLRKAGIHGTSKARFLNKNDVKKIHTKEDQMKDTLSVAEASESWNKVRDPFSAIAK